MGGHYMPPPPPDGVILRPPSSARVNIAWYGQILRFFPIEGRVQHMLAIFKVANKNQSVDLPLKT